jgi:hypothetical protein
LDFERNIITFSFLGGAKINAKIYLRMDAQLLTSTSKNSKI